MIIAFSGTDGIGKSTQLEKILNLLEHDSIDYRVKYIRGGCTTFAKLYRHLIAFLGIDSSSTLILKIGLNISIIELIYHWGIKLRWMNRKHRVILCDRYVWDTYVDFVQKYNYCETGLWDILIRIVPKPNISILYMANEETIIKRLQKKEPHLDNNYYSVKSAMDIYKSIKYKFDFILNAEKSIDVLFEDTLNCLKSRSKDYG